MPSQLQGELPTRTVKNDTFVLSFYSAVTKGVVELIKGDYISSSSVSSSSSSSTSSSYSSSTSSESSVSSSSSSSSSISLSL